jgi:hypothetical protein
MTRFSSDLESSAETSFPQSLFGGIVVVIGINSIMKEGRKRREERRAHCLSIDEENRV